MGCVLNFCRLHGSGHRLKLHGPFKCFIATRFSFKEINPHSGRKLEALDTGKSWAFHMVFHGQSGSKIG